MDVWKREEDVGGGVFIGGGGGDTQIAAELGCPRLESAPALPGWSGIGRAEGGRAAPDT